MQRKVGKYLDYILLLFRIPEQKAKETKDFVLQFDYESLTEELAQRLSDGFNN
jgi:hypothetical protein